MEIDPIRTSQSSATLVVAANDSTPNGKSRADYVCDGTDDQVEINAAIQALPANGGKVLLLEGTFIIESSVIPTQDNWAFAGLGRGTVLKLVDSAALNTRVLQINDGITDWAIRDIYFDGNKANQSNAQDAVIYIDNTSAASLHALMHHIWVENGKTGVGIYAINPRRCHMVQSIIQNNDSHGVHQTENHLEMYGCRLQYNGGDGLHADSMFDNILEGCQFQYNSGHGISYVSSSVVANCNIMTNDGFGIAEAISARISNCGIRWNNQTGVLLKSYCTLVGNRIENNSYDDAGAYDNVELDSAWYTIITGNQIGSLNGDARYDINITSNPDSSVPCIVGNSFRKETVAILNTVSESYIWKDNQVNDIVQVQEQQILMYKNTSGVGLVQGDIVILKSVAAGNEMTTTTVQGDDRVLGMSAETKANNSIGHVLVLGKTTKLKVDGTEDISIGDFIGTFTTAKIGMKAAAGDMAFAIALEAYTSDDSNGVIDALLIKPRKI